MNLSLEGKTALITGGNTGIGRSISLALAQFGADVVLTHYAHEAEASETVHAIKLLGRKAFSLHLDATDSVEVNAVVKTAAEMLGGRIDILVNNAGSLVGRVPISQMTDEHWRRTMDLNLSSAFYAIRAALPYMEDGRGRIVNITSVSAHHGGGTGAVAYSVAKAGLIVLTRGLAKELAPRKITVNSVAPGLIVGTHFHEVYSTPEIVKAQTAGIPLGRAGTPDDVSGAVLYLVSDMAGFVTGVVTDVNGGAWFS